MKIYVVITHDDEIFVTTTQPEVDDYNRYIRFTDLAMKTKIELCFDSIRFWGVCDLVEFEKSQIDFENPGSVKMPVVKPKRKKLADFATLEIKQGTEKCSDAD